MCLDGKNMKNKGMEVFQELTIYSIIDFNSLRTKIIEQEKEGWSHDLEKERNLRNDMRSQDDVIVFRRKSFDDIDEVLLILWQSGNKYSVTNIVPCNVIDLGVYNYNIIMNDFVEKIILPLKINNILNFDLSNNIIRLNERLDKLTADALILFLRSANKMTGLAHPIDCNRWIKFIIQSHKSNIMMSSHELSQWLADVEEWPEEQAIDLAINYEFSRNLLNEYDKR